MNTETNIDIDIDIDIRQATEGDIPALYALYDALGKADVGYFEACFDKDCLILVASLPAAAEEEEEEPILIGFGILNFEPKYRLYQALDIPEIQDLNVLAEYRERGIGGALLDAFENIARDQGVEKMGISVGLTKEYGAAQRLYIKRGYIPDGYGATYDREAVTSGASYPLDDDLALMLVKDFQINY